MRTVFSAALLLLLSATATAQDGTLDPTFGNGGIVKTIIGDKANVVYEHTQKIFVQNDGKLISVVHNGNLVFLTRRLPDGNLDSAYGDAGVSVAVPFQNPCTGALQPDENVVLAAVSASPYAGAQVDFQLIRITREGRLDSTFGVVGKVTTDFGYETDVPASVVIQKDGKIVVAGTASHNSNMDGVFAVARYNADGTPDETFGTGGKTTTDFGSRTFGNAVTLEDGGKIVVAGTSYDSNGINVFAVARYTLDGSLDQSFGQAGKTTTAINSANLVANSVAVDKNNNIVVGGTAYRGPFNFSFTAVRYTNSGDLDYSFNGSGMAQADFGYQMNGVQAMVLQPDNKIVLGGYTGEPGLFDARFAVARFDTDGSLDATFNDSGKTTCAFEKYNESFIYALALQPDGKMVATGFTRTYTAQDMALTRFNINGSLDASFGQGGKIADYIKENSTASDQFLVQPDGKLLVQAGVFNGDSVNSVLTRYTATGAMDTTFGKKGVLPLDGRLVMLIGLQTDGKIIAGSYTFDYKEFSFYRFHANGTTDSSYGLHGKRIITSNGFNGLPGVQIQPDNKVLVLSYSFPPGLFSPVYSLTRYMMDGTPDSSFGSGGKLELDAAAYILRLQPDGKIITAGYETPSSYTQYTIRRYTPGGAIDDAYGQNGKATVDFSLRDLAFQPNGDLIVSGSAGNWPDNYTIMSRITVRGRSDSTFGQQGKVNTIGPWLAVQANGSILTGGSKKDASGHQIVAVGRFTSNGRADSTFGTQGLVETDIDPKRDDYASQLHIFKNRLYVLGNSSYFGVYGFVAAYTIDDNPTALQCTPDKTVSTDKGVCIAKAYEIDPVGTPANSVIYILSGATQGTGIGTASGTIFNKGVTYVRYFLQSDTTQTCTFKVTVKDTEAPIITGLSVSTPTLWAAPNLMRDIRVNYHASDNCGLAGIKLTVTSNEPVLSGESGDRSPDWEIINTHAVRLRAERLQQGTGRIYTITVTATDSAGNSTTKTATVTVSRPETDWIKDYFKNTFRILAFPNPTRYAFYVSIISGNTTDPVQLRVLNSAGSVMEVRTAKAYQAVQLGARYRPGVYYVEAVQGSQRATLTLIKR